MSGQDNDRRIDYIEFTGADVARSKAFFAEVFGWKFTDYGDDYTSFEDGRMTGGFRKGEAAAPAGSPLVVLYAADLQDTQARVEAAGGAITVPIFSFPGGRRFHFREPSGNELAVWSK
jgi:hypothetical protein